MRARGSVGSRRGRHVRRATIFGGVALVAGALSLASCRQALGISDDGSGALGDDAGDAPLRIDAADASVDPSADGTVSGDGAACDLSKPFGAVINVSELNTEDLEESATFSADGLNAYFARGATSRQIYTASRSRTSEPFGAAVPINADNMGGELISPFVTSDNTSLYFATNLMDAGGQGNFDIFFVSPPSSATFVAVAQLNGPSEDAFPWITASGDGVYFTSTRAGGPGSEDIWFAPVVDGNVGSPALVPGINSSAFDNSPVVTSDGKTMFFDSTRNGYDQIWIATRSDAASAFGAPRLLEELATNNHSVPSWISPDGCTLYFHSLYGYPGAKGSWDIYSAERPK